MDDQRIDADGITYEELFRMDRDDCLHNVELSTKRSVEP